MTTPEEITKDMDVDLSYEIDAVARVPRVKVLSLPSTQAVSLVMNCQMPPFDDVRVRRAMNLAINQQEILDALLNESMDVKVVHLKDYIDTTQPTSKTF